MTQPGAPRVIGRAGDVLSEQLSRPLEAGLYLVATPIGNLADITLRALAVLARADVVAAEDTRRSRVLMSHYGLSPQMIAYHDHNGDEMRPRLLEMIAAGQAVALVSDAGMPLISDPGYKLAKAVRGAGLMVEVVPGASSVMAGLALSGLPTDRFLFAGFLPPKQEARRRALEGVADVAASLIFFETVKRVHAVLEDMAAVLPGREVALAREITKLHQEVISGPVETVRAKLADRRLKGELVLLVGPPTELEVNDAAIEAALRTELAAGNSVKGSVAAVTEALGLRRGRVYDIAKGLKRELKGPEGQA